LFFDYLLDNKDVQNLFIEEFFIKKCEHYLSKKENEKADELIEMVVHDIFLEHSSKFPNWRVVEIQQKVI